MPITNYTPAAKDLIVGMNYKVRLTSGIWVLAEYKAPIQRGWGSHCHFLFRNLQSDRTIEIKSRIRIRDLQAVHGVA
jgi:hypothetical protein